MNWNFLGNCLRRIDHQTYLTLREGAQVVEVDLFGDKVLRLSDGSFLKLFRRKRLLSSAAWYPYAQRFSDNAVALERLGVLVPTVVDVMRIASIGRDAVHYLPLEGSSLRMLSSQALEVDTEVALKAEFNQFVVQLHDKGIYFRSLHLGNVIRTRDGRMGLIDFADLRICRKPLSIYMRRRNIKRLRDTVSERDWLDERVILKT